MEKRKIIFMEKIRYIKKYDVWKDEYIITLNEDNTSSFYLNWKFTYRWESSSDVVDEYKNNLFFNYIEGNKLYLIRNGEQYMTFVEKDNEEFDWFISDIVVNWDDIMIIVSVDWYYKFFLNKKLQWKIPESYSWMISRREVKLYGNWKYVVELNSIQWDYFIEGKIFNKYEGLVDITYDKKWENFFEIKAENDNYIILCNSEVIYSTKNILTDVKYDGDYYLYEMLNDTLKKININKELCI